MIIITESKLFGLHNHVVWQIYKFLVLVCRIVCNTMKNSRYFQFIKLIKLLK